MNDLRCRYCTRFLCSVLAREGKIRITCTSCKRMQTIDLAVQKVRGPDHLTVVGLS